MKYELYYDDATNQIVFVKGAGNVNTVASVPDPIQQSYSPAGSVTVPTGKFVIMAKTLTVAGTNRFTLQGNARLVIL